MILVLKIGGRDFFNPLEGKDYFWYISGMYCQLGDYMLPTTFYKNLKLLWLQGHIQIPETYISPPKARFNMNPPPPC